MPAILLKNARIFDGMSEDCLEGQQVLIEAGRIREISSKPIKTSEARVFELGGRTLMP
jgi:dihydroorotase-like cyclic amidohydrolase